MLGKRPLHEGGHVVLRVADRAEAVGQAHVADELYDNVGEYVPCVLRPGPGDLGSHQPRCVEMPFGVRRPGVPEHRGRVQDHRHPMRHDRLVARVVAGHEVPDHAGHGVRHAVRQVAARVAEPDSRERGGEKHLSARLGVVGVVDGAAHVLSHHLDGLQRPYVADRVGALIGRAQAGVRGGLAAAERQGRVRLKPVTQHVEPAARRDHRRQVAHVVGIHNAHDRPQRPVGDPRLGLHLK